MKTYKRLGLCVRRTSKSSNWTVSGDGVSYSAAGNKGEVVHNALHQSGCFELVGSTWRRKDESNS